MKYTISGEQCLGFHCGGGGEYTEWEAEVELDDSQVQALVDLIRENDGETDVYALCLEDELPEIYELLDEACRDAATAAEYRYWALEAIDSNGFEQPDDLMERLEEDGLFNFDLDAYAEENGTDPEDIDEYDIEDAKSEAFNKWFTNYYHSLDDDGKYKFLAKYYTDQMDDIDVSDVEYEVLIPDEIVDMALEE